jgi:molybdate transport system substrate-binding protein
VLSCIQRQGVHRFIAAIFFLFMAARVSGETINVAAAISLKEAMLQIAAGYEAETGNHVDFTFGSSGQLMAQIKSGAPVDAFISAADKQVADLEKLGLIDPNSRRNIASNTLVLILPANTKIRVSGFQDLADPAVGKVAIGEPRTVPAGQYAQQVLHKLGLEPALTGRLIYGSNVRQVLDYVERGEVSAGIVYRTDAMLAGASVKVAAAADDSTYEPINYPAVIINASKKQPIAREFLDYLASDEARSVMKSKGFTTAGQAGNAKS